MAFIKRYYMDRLGTVFETVDARCFTVYKPNICKGCRSKHFKLTVLNGTMTIPKCVIAHTLKRISKTRALLSLL